MQPSLCVRNIMVTLWVDFDCFWLSKPLQKVKIHLSGDNAACYRQSGWDFIYLLKIQIYDNYRSHGKTSHCNWLLVKITLLWPQCCTNESFITKLLSQAMEKVYWVMLWSCFTLPTDPHLSTLPLSHPFPTDPFHRLTSEPCWTQSACAMQWKKS